MEVWLIVILTHPLVSAKFSVSHRVSVHRLNINQSSPLLKGSSRCWVGEASPATQTWPARANGRSSRSEAPTTGRTASSGLGGELWALEARLRHVGGQGQGVVAQGPPGGPCDRGRAGGRGQTCPTWGCDGRRNSRPSGAHHWGASADDGPFLSPESALTLGTSEAVAPTLLGYCPAYCQGGIFVQEGGASFPPFTRCWVGHSGGDAPADRSRSSSVTPGHSPSLAIRSRAPRTCEKMLCRGHL